MVRLRRCFFASSLRQRFDLAANGGRRGVGAQYEAAKLTRWRRRRRFEAVDGGGGRRCSVQLERVDAVEMKRRRKRGKAAECGRVVFHLVACAPRSRRAADCKRAAKCCNPKMRARKFYASMPRFSRYVQQQVVARVGCFSNRPTLRPQPAAEHAALRRPANHADARRRQRPPPRHSMDTKRADLRSQPPPSSSGVAAAVAAATSVASYETRAKAE